MKHCPLCRTVGCSRLERHLNDIALLKCGSCGFVYADLPDELVLRANSTYDDETEDRYSRQQTFLDDMWFQRIAVRFTERLGPRSVLDVGCGNGRLLRAFRCLGWECYGVDISPWSAKFADRYGFEFYSGSIEDSALQFGEFDLVVSSSTLEHIAQPVRHVQAIAQALKPGGSAYFCGMPNYASLSVRLGLSTFHSNFPPGHVNFFTAETLAKLFQFTGVSLQKAAVRTYGVPELHRVYRGLVHVIRVRHVSAPRDAHVRNPSLPCDSAGEPGSLKRALARLLLNVFYHCGRVGRVGDKLEALIIMGEGQ